METLWSDLSYGIRILLKSPGFTFVAVLTLALGIGANTALFSVVNAVLLTPLSYPEPDRLLKIYQRTAQFDQGSVSYPNFLDWRRDNHTFAQMAAQRSDDFNLTGAGEAERLHGEMVSAQFFPLLGIRPLLGRTFTPEEDRPGGPPVALISVDLWKRKFGSSSDILGRTISLNGTGWTVIGVLATTAHLEPNRDLYVPIGQWNDPHFLDRRMSFGMHVFAQLAPGATLSQARDDMERISHNLAASYPEADGGKAVTLVPLKQDIVGNVRPFLLVLLAAVGFVLLIACTNVANLLLARSTGRMREFAIRAALGAGRVRLIRQLVTESVLIALLGGGIGLLLSAWGTQAVLGLLPSGLPRGDTIGLDGRVLLFTLAISVLAGFLFGLVPAFRTSQTHVQNSLRENGKGLTGGRQRIHGFLVITEMAMALVLLSGAGLMIRSLTSLWNVDPGFNPHNLMVFGFSVAPSLLSSPAESRSAIRMLQEKLKDVPGVEAVSVAGGSLPMNSDSSLPFWLEGQPRPLSDNEKNWTLLYLDQQDYLKAMGIPLRRGRFFTSHDDEHSPFVAVVDEAFARKYYPNQDAIGKRVNLDLIGAAEIVGVVGHIKQWGLDSSGDRLVQAQIHLHVLQTPDQFMPMVARGMTVVLRARGAPLSLVPAIRQVVGQMNNEQVMYNVQTMDTIIFWSLAVRRFSMILLALFASLALILAGVGIYGLISYTVGQRTREIGIRIALGAARKDVLRAIVGQGAKMAGIGVVIGLVAGLVLARLISTMLYGVSPSDPLTFLAAAALLMMVALAACYVPARRAMNVDPINALRCE